MFLFWKHFNTKLCVFWQPDVSKHQHGRYNNATTIIEGKMCTHNAKMCLQGCCEAEVTDLHIRRSVGDEHLSIFLLSQVLSGQPWLQSGFISFMDHSYVCVWNQLGISLLMINVFFVSYITAEWFELLKQFSPQTFAFEAKIIIAVSLSFVFIFSRTFFHERQSHKHW